MSTAETTPAPPTAERLVTAEELLAMPHDGMRRELIEGKVVEMTPGGDEHGAVGGAVSGELYIWAKAAQAGRVIAAETGFLIRRNPDSVRAPDVAFFRADRVPPRRGGYYEVMPDLVVEVVSPNDRAGEVYRKVGEWLDAGVPLVLVVWPATQRVTVHRSPSEVTSLGVGETFTADDLLPGFALAVSDIFA